MAVQPGVWGIDLGQCALKAIRVENIDGQVTATNFDYVEHPKILSQPDADPDQLTREALEKFLSRNPLRGDIVAISIPGQSGLARFVKLPPVEEKKIPDIVRFEAKQQIPFNLEEVVWDYQKLGDGTVTDGFAMDTEIGLFAIKRDTVNRSIQSFKDVNVEVHIVQMAPLALCNFVAYDLLDKGKEGGEAESDKKRCVVALDIGADNSNLVITDGQRIIWQRPIPLGGNHFTRALTKDMKLTFAKAEHLKRNATKSPELKQILSSLKPVLNDFVGEVQRSLGYFTNTHRDASILYMVGLGSAFRLPGLQKFLGEKLQLDVRKLQKLERLTGDAVINAPVFTENVLSFAVAYGLAIQGLKVGRLRTNLLPQEIQVERMIRAKKPWALTAAASLLIGTAVMGVGYNMQYRAVGNDLVAGKIKDGDGVLGEVSQFKTKVSNIQTQIANDVKAVKSIVIGQDERLNWIYFNQVVNDTLPKPDGSNLSAEAKAAYWNEDAQTALDNFLAQARGTAKASVAAPQPKGKKNQGPSKLDEEVWRANLIQANVESVYCVFCNDLGGYFKGVAKQLEDNNLHRFRVNEKAIKAALPDGRGWIVEVRGYTYHKGERQFVLEAVADNFNHVAPIVPPKDKQGATPAPGGSEPAPATPPAPGKASTSPAPATSGSTSPAPAASGTSAAPAADPKAPGAISHVVVFQCVTDDAPEPGSYRLINQSFVDGLNGGAVSTPTPGASAGGGASGLSGGQTQPARSASSWTPMASPTGSGAAPVSSGGLSGGFPSGVGKNPPMMPGSPPGSAVPGAARGNVGTRGVQPTVRTDAPRQATGRSSRTEFVILFIWKEPTPSDDLLPSDSGPSSSPTSSAPAGFGSGFGMPAGAVPAGAPR
jgi:type IV pilus assembly protein PilM